MIQNPTCPLCGLRRGRGRLDRPWSVPATSLHFVVSNESGEIVAATRHVEEAIMIAAHFTFGVVTFGPHVVWHDGHEDDTPAYSMENCVAIARRRIDAIEEGTQ